MKPAHLFLPFLLSATALCHAVSKRYTDNGIVFRFDEPVVHTSELYEQNPANITVTGDADHQPDYSWTDQDTLTIRFKRGTSVRTKFQLAFKPGQDKYLGGGAITPNAIEFSCPMSELDVDRLDGTPTPAFCVSPTQLLSKEALGFSPASPIQYEFRELKRINPTETCQGRVVPAKAEPAPLSQIPSKHAALEVLADAKVDWKTVSGDTIVPGFVIVRAPHKLDPGSVWEFSFKPQENCEFSVIEPNPDTREEILLFTPEEEMGTGLIQYISRPGKQEVANGAKPGMRLKVKFSSPVRQADLPSILSKMTIRCGEHVATNGADNKTKKITIGGKETLFSIVDEELESAEYEPRIYRQIGESGCRIGFRSEPTVSAMVLAVSDMVPADLDIIIPQGIAAANGLITTCDHLHRISFNPAYPQLGAGHLQLPLHGDHHFRLLTTNAESVELKAWHIDAATIIKLTQAGKKIPNLCEQNDVLDRLKYRLATELKRKELIPTESDSTIRTIRSAIASIELKNTYKNARIQALLQQLTAFEPHRVNLHPSDDSAVLYSQETAVNLNDLTGGNTKPGLYVISTTPKVSAAVRKQAESLGIDSTIFETSSYLLLQVTDLFCSTPADQLIITRLNDGSLVREAEIYATDGTKHTMSDGVFHIATNDRKSRPQMVVCGEDYAKVSSEHYFNGNRPELRHEIIVDRPLYRPGDTVHLRGILRRVSATGESAIAKDVKSVQLSILKPNRELLLRQDIAVDEFGAWAEDFTLPTGEDDVTGNYTVIARVSGTYSDTKRLNINCQIFRRDAFESKTTLQVDKIAPRTFSATVQATDLNGSPLSHASVDLNISCSHSMISLTPEAQPQSNISHTAETDARGNLTLQGYITGDFSPRSAGVANLRISGSVANDRQEYKKLSPASEVFFAADFVPTLQGKCLHLHPAGADERTPLPREQKLHVRIMATVTQDELLPGGIIISQTPQQCLFEQEITLPANCREGYPLPIDAILNNTNNKISDRELSIHVSGTDTAGRKLQAILHWLPWWREPHDATKEPTLQASHEQGALQLQIEAPRTGEALFLLQSRKGIRLQSVQLNEQKETLRIPLQEGENGDVRVQFMQTVCGESKLFTDWSTASVSCSLPRPDMQLDVQLLLPEQELRPGSECEIAGCVALPDGTAAEAEVTLFAVDEGMLSVDYYELPDLPMCFGDVRLPSIQVNNLTWRGASTAYADSLVLMAPVWKGDIVGAGRYLPLVSNVRKARVYKVAGTRDSFRAQALAAVDNEWEADDNDGVAFLASEIAPVPSPQRALDDDTEESENGADEQPHLRSHFAPVAVWQAALRTDAQGQFRTQVKLPDTLTTWHIFAVAIDKSGNRFGSAENEIIANQPVMITPGTPFFMSLGDCLRLPLTITNNTKTDGTWQVSLEGANSPQHITLKAGSTGTLFFDFIATQEGNNTLRWTATAPAGADAVEGQFPVRFPAPTLKETHHLVQTAGQAELRLASLAAPELARATRSSIVIELSANPLLHLASCMDFVLSYPYGCTEQTASALLPWIYHSRLAPFSPTMESKDRAEVNKIISQSVEKLFKRQQTDGGLGYWGDAKKSCLWASAQAALVFTIAEEQGYTLPAEPMSKLRAYLAARTEAEKQELSPFTRYAIGRVCGDESLISQALEEVLSDTTASHSRWTWCGAPSVKEDIRFIAALRSKPAECHAAFQQWMRSRGHDYRHNTTWQSAWMLIALGEYLRLQPEHATQATVQLQDGQQLSLSNGITRLTPPSVNTPAELPTTITTTTGTAYLNVKFHALPEQTNYPGVTEKGLQITRVYEKEDAAGNWVPTSDFRVGDVVRVTLTCAKVAPEFQYIVLEDYLPACMESINPNIPGQAAGLNWKPWSIHFDHKEYLADRVRGFCTRWAGRDLLNMSYYARVKRAGTSTAPPAQAQLMYEPQIYGLSPNSQIISK